MYRIDTFRPNETKPASPPVYISLATALAPSHQGTPADDQEATATTGGHLVTVGRRACTILLEKDKSVSRHHLHLHLLSNDAHHQQPLLRPVEGEEEEKVVAQAAGIPQSKEEKEACEKNPLGMALVIKCQGKFGSAVMAFGQRAGGDNNDCTSKAGAGGGDDDATDDGGGSDTEDESQKPAKIDWASGNIPDLPHLKLFDNTKHIVSQMMKKTSPGGEMGHGLMVIVPPKKVMANEECVVPGNATTIILQCGQMGSLLVIHRLDLSICKSGWTKKEEKLWDSQLYCVGATLVKTDVEATLFQDHEDRQTRPQHALTPWVDDGDTDDHDLHGLPRTTYMIAPKREVVAKQLIAFNLGIPMASPKFLDAMLQRTEPTDPWPSIEDYEPDPMSVDRDEIDEGFWKQTLNSRLLDSCTLLTTSEKAKECEYLVQSAGGTVVPVYSMKDKEAQAKIQALLDDPEKKDGLFAISSSRKKKIAVWIDKQGIPHLKLKELVVAITQQKQLTGEHGQVIGRKAVAQTLTESGKDKDVSAGKQAEEDIEMEESNKGGKEDSLKEKVGAIKSKRKSDHVDEVNPKEQSQTKRARSNDRGHETSRLSQTSSERGMDILPPVEEEHSKLDDTAASQANENSLQVDDDDDEEKGRSKRSMSAKQKRNNKPDEDNVTTIVGVKQRVMKGTGSKKLEQTNDGWLVCAPKNAALRQAYLKPRSQMLEAFSDDDEKPPVVAETILMPGLIHRPYDPNRKSIATVGAKARGGKDFKKFRKNSITQAKSRIELRSELPKETQRQKELEEQQRQIDAQAELADELFNIGSGSRQSRIAKTTRKRR